MRELAAEGMTMIVVTHEMRFAREVGTAVVFMDQGVVIERGSPAGVLERPREERTKQFLGLVLEH
jgi:ABC-type histidine transport system ATPase subunit